MAKMGKPIRRKSNKEGRGTLRSLKHETALAPRAYLLEHGVESG